MNIHLNKSYFDGKLIESSKKVTFYVTYIFTAKLEVLMHFNDSWLRRRYLTFRNLKVTNTTTFINVKKILHFAQSIFMNSVWTPGQPFPHTALTEWLYYRSVAIPRYELNI